MSIAAYNRGTRAISAHISQCLREARTEVTVPALPVGWSITVSTDLLTVRDESETMIHREAIPYQSRPDLNRACLRALDPCLRQICPEDGGHALNGWQLHYGP